jgi:hypothetical protein
MPWRGYAALTSVDGGAIAADGATHDNRASCRGWPALTGAGAAPPACERIAPMAISQKPGGYLREAGVGVLEAAGRGKGCVIRIMAILDWPHGRVREEGASCCSWLREITRCEKFGL